MGGRSGDLYRLGGRVLDAQTQRGLPQVRLRLQAKIPTALGASALVTYGLTREDGTYELELGAGFDLMRLAERIRLDAGKPGYEPSGADISPPTQKRASYTAPDIILHAREAKPFHFPSESPETR